MLNIVLCTKPNKPQCSFTEACFYDTLLDSFPNLFSGFIVEYFTNGSQASCNFSLERMIGHDATFCIQTI